MSDTRTAMREFRFLDDKRNQGSLSPAEEHRWTELRVALGMGEPAPAAAPEQYAQGYYASDGNWYPYPQQGYEGYPQQPYDPNGAYAYPQSYDPNAPGYDPNAPAYDPNAPAYPQQAWDPNAQAWAAQGYDPNYGYPQQPYDPNAYPAYDPNAPQDPNAYAQQYGYAYPQQGYAPPESYPQGYAQDPAYDAYAQQADRGMTDPAGWGQELSNGVELPADAAIPESPVPAPTPAEADLLPTADEAEVMEVDEADVTMMDEAPADAPVLEAAPETEVPVFDAATLSVSPEAPTLDAASLAEPAAEPAAETPTFDAASLEEPAAEAPTFDAASLEEPAAETPTLDAASLEEPVAETPTLDAASLEEPVAALAEPAAETPALDAGPVGETQSLETASLSETSEETITVEPTLAPVSEPAEILVSSDPLEPEDAGSPVFAASETEPQPPSAWEASAELDGSREAEAQPAVSGAPAELLVSSDTVEAPVEEAPASTADAEPTPSGAPPADDAPAELSAAVDESAHASEPPRESIELPEMALEGDPADAVPLAANSEFVPESDMSARAGIELEGTGQDDQIETGALADIAQNVGQYAPKDKTPVVASWDTAIPEAPAAADATAPTELAAADEAQTPAAGTEAPQETAAVEDAAPPAAGTDAPLAATASDAESPSSEDSEEAATPAAGTEAPLEATDTHADTEDLPTPAAGTDAPAIAAAEEPVATLEADAAEPLAVAVSDSAEPASVDDFAVEEASAEEVTPAEATPADLSAPPEHPVIDAAELSPALESADAEPQPRPPAEAAEAEGQLDRTAFGGAPDGEWSAPPEELATDSSVFGTAPAQWNDEADPVEASGPETAGPPAHLTEEAAAALPELSADALELQPADVAQTEAPVALAAAAETAAETAPAGDWAQAQLDAPADWAQPQGEATAEWAQPQAEATGDWAQFQAEATGDWAQPQTEAPTDWAQPQAEATAGWAPPQAEATADWAPPQAEATAEWAQPQAEAVPGGEWPNAASGNDAWAQPEAGWGQQEGSAAFGQPGEWNAQAEADSGGSPWATEAAPAPEWAAAPAAEAPAAPEWNAEPPPPPPTPWQASQAAAPLEWAEPGAAPSPWVTSASPDPASAWGETPPPPPPPEVVESEDDLPTLEAVPEIEAEPEWEQPPAAASAPPSPPDAAWDEDSVDVDLSVTGPHDVAALTAARPPPAPVEEVDEAALPAIEIEPEPEAEVEDFEIDTAPLPPPAPAATPIRVSPPPVAATVTAVPPVPPVPPRPAPAITPRASSVQVELDELAPTLDTSQGLAAFGDDRGPALNPSFVEGEHRVIIHTLEGQVKRGMIRDLDLLDDAIPLEQQTGFAPERIPTNRVKAIFFMLPAGSRPPATSGQKIRVTFNDGRQVAGFSDDYRNADNGFFMIPADNRTNTARIYIFRAAVRAVGPG